MELGISTVVMLVIAIVIIGAAIAFIRGFFAKGDESLMGAFDIVDFRVEPSRTNPLVLSSGNELRIKPADKVRIGIGYYNKDAEAEFEPDVDCDNGAGSNGGVDLLVGEQKIGSGAIGTFEAIISATDPGHYVCTLSMKGSDVQSQFIMIVQN